MLVCLAQTSESKMKQRAGSEEGRGYHHSPQEQQQQQQYYHYPPQAGERASSQSGGQVPQASAPPYYGTFQGHPSYPQPARPGYPSPSPQYAYQPVPGYPVIEPRSAVDLPRLPCCGLGIGWCLFISGWFLASIPWYVGAIILMCTRPDPRERVGLVCCTIAAILSLIAAIVGGTTATN